MPDEAARAVHPDIGIGLGARVLAVEEEEHSNLKSA